MVYYGLILGGFPDPSKAAGQLFFGVMTSARIMCHTSLLYKPSESLTKVLPLLLTFPDFMHYRGDVPYHQLKSIGDPLT